MRKQVFGRHLKRDTHERKALFRGLASSLVLHERIETTEEKAKAVKGYVEKLVTKAKKKENTEARRLLEASLSHDALLKLVNEIAPRFLERPGGYTRIIKRGNRFSDNASMVYLEWVVRSSLDTKSALSSSKAVKKGKTDGVAAEASVEVPAKKVTKKAVSKTKKTTEKTSTKTSGKKTISPKKQAKEKTK